MAQTITHNIDAVLKGLDLYTRTKVPKAARVAIGRLGFDIANKFVPDRMNMVFERPNQFTLKSLNYKVVSNYEVQLDFRKDVGKGNDPARYLYPSTVGGPAYETKFSRYLHAAGIAPANYYPIPVRSNLKLNSYGKPSQGEYTKAWNGLQSRYGMKSKGAYRYFSVPDMRPGGQSGGLRFRSVGARRNPLGNGIYRVKGSSAKGTLDLQLLFTYAKSKPRTPNIFDYQSFVAKVVERRAEGTFRRAFKEALR
jgi:hypothetical protein